MARVKREFFVTGDRVLTLNYPLGMASSNYSPETAAQLREAYINRKGTVVSNPNISGAVKVRLDSWTGPYLYWAPEHLQRLSGLDAILDLVDEE